MDCTQLMDCSVLEEVTYDQKVEVGKLIVDNEEFTVFSGKNTIGRDPEFCSIVLNNTTLSKEHAVIEVAQKNAHVIYDLGSKNKTKLGKVGLAPHVRYFLPHKTILQFGEVLAEYVIMEETSDERTAVEDSDDDMIPATPAPSSKFAPELSSNSASPTLFEISTQCDCGTPETCGKLLGEPCGLDSTGKQSSREANFDQAANGGDCPISSKDLTKESKCDEVKLKDVCVDNCTPLKEKSTNKIDCTLNKISVEDEDSLTDDEIYCAATQIVSSANQDFKQTRQSDGIPRSTIDETLNSTVLSDSSVRCDTKQSLDCKSVSSLFEEYIETDFKKPMARRKCSSTEKSFVTDLKLVKSGSKQNEVNNFLEDGIFNVAGQSVPYVNNNQNTPMEKQNIKSFDSKNSINCGTPAENKSISEASVEVKIEHQEKDMQKNMNNSIIHEPFNDADKHFDKCVVDVGEEAKDIYTACTQVVNALCSPNEKTPDQHLESKGGLMAEDIHVAATQVLISSSTVVKKSDKPVERSAEEEGQDIHNAATQVFISPGTVKKSDKSVERSAEEEGQDIHNAATQVLVSPSSVEKTGEQRAKNIHNIATQVLISPSSVSNSVNSSKKKLSALTTATSEVSPNYCMSKDERSAGENDDFYVAPTQILPPVVEISCRKEEIDYKQEKNLGKKTFNNRPNKEQSNEELKDKKSNIEGDTDTQVDESFFSAPTQVINHETDLNVGSGGQSPVSTSSTYSSIHEEPTQCMDEIATSNALRVTTSDNTGVTLTSNLPSEACETVGILLPISSSSSSNVNRRVKKSFSATQVVSHDIEAEKSLVEANKSPLSTSSSYSSIHEDPTQCMDEIVESIPGRNDSLVTSTPILASKTLKEAGTSVPFVSHSAANVNNEVRGATSENHNRVDTVSFSDGIANESMELVIPSSEELIKASKTIYGNTSDSETEKNYSPIIRTRNLRSSNFRNIQKVRRCLRSIKESDLDLSVSSSGEIPGRKNPDANDSQGPLCRKSSRRVENQGQDTSKEVEKNKLKNVKIAKEKTVSVRKSTKENSFKGENVHKLVSEESSKRPLRLRKMTWKMRESSHSPAADDSKSQSASDDVEANSKERKIGSVTAKNEDKVFQAKSVSDNHSKSLKRGDKYSCAPVCNKNERDSNILSVDSRTRDELMVEKAFMQNKKETSSKAKGKESSKLKLKTTSQENLDKPTKQRDSMISSKSLPHLSANTSNNLKNDTESSQEHFSVVKKNTRRSTRSSNVQTSVTNSPIHISTENDHVTTTRQRRNTRNSVTASPTAMLKKMEQTEGRLSRRISSVSVAVDDDDDDRCASALFKERGGTPRKDNPMRKSSRIQKESANLVNKKEKTRSRAANLKDRPNEIGVSNEVEKEKSIALKRSSRKSVGTAPPCDAEVVSSGNTKIMEKSESEVLENATGTKRRKRSDSVSNRITASTICDSTKKLDCITGSPELTRTRTRKFLKEDNESTSEKASRSKRSSAANKEKLEDGNMKSSTSKKFEVVTSSSCDENNESTISVNSKVKKQRLKKIAEENSDSSSNFRILKRIVQSESTESLSSVSESSPKRSCRFSKKPQYHVLYTGVSTSKEEERVIKKLGGKVVEEMEECSVLVTDKVRRTLKFLCILAQGKPIVSKEWILKSQGVGHFLDPWDFIVEDKEAEQKYKFQLKVSLKHAAMKKLLDGYFVYATRSITPPPSEMKDIIEYSGGTFLSQEPSSNSWPEKSFVIASINDKRLVTKLKKKSIDVVHAELILTGVLQQKLNFNEYVLTC